MKKKFNKAFNLKTVSAYVLLLVFTLGITPKRTLHNWFANHKDSTTTIPHSKAPQLTKAGFTCSCDDLVAESHFLSAGSIEVINIRSFCNYISYYKTTLISFSNLYDNLRGPPIKILAA